MRKFYVKSVGNRVSIKNCLILFKNDTKGIFAIITAMLIAPVLILSMGAMFDYGRYLMQARKIQTSLDAAVLNSAQYIGRKSKKEITEHIQKDFSINYTSTGTTNVPIISVKMSSGLITASGRSFMKTSILSLIGVKQLSLPVFASLSYHASTVDVALVFDTSGSMKGPPLQKLQKASFLFLDILFGDIKEDHPSLQVGIVPFANAVQLNPQLVINEQWMDLNALSPIHSENFSTAINRFDLYNKIGIAWKGCVESRPYPYDVHDYNPTFNEMTVQEKNAKTDKNARFFVPWFEPDHPIHIGGGGNRNYLNDNDADIAKYNLQVPANLAHLQINEVHARNWFQHHGNANKYTKANRAIVAQMGGPESSCKPQSHGARPPKRGSQMLTDLNNNYGEIKQRINELEAVGRTNILSGFTWGWRMLSPGEPLTKGNHGSRKVLILLTDGDNTDSNVPNSKHHIVSYQPYTYGSYGLPYLNRLNIDAGLQLREYLALQSENERGGAINRQASTARIAQLNKRLFQACIHAKKTGIEVYTIAYGPGTHKTTHELLKHCASSNEHFYRAQSRDLESVFGQVAGKVSRLYLSQ